MKMIHLTDLHLAPTSAGTPYAITADRTRRAIEIINAEHGDAELCVVTGDLVYGPDPEAYALAEEILSQLNMHVVCTLGNHDDRQLALKHLSFAQADENGFAQQVIETEQGVAIILDTKAEGTHGGELCELRRNWLATQLETHDKPIWLFMHHPPFPTGLKAMDTIGMKRSDAEALGTLVQDHRHIQHLFFGHFHRPIAGNWRNISFSSHRSMMLQCALDLETKAHVPAIHEEPQLAVILAEDGLLTVHYHDFMSDKELLSMGPADGEEHLR